MTRPIFVLVIFVLCVSNALASCLPATGLLLSPTSQLVGRATAASLYAVEQAATEGTSFSAEMREWLLALRAEGHGLLSRLWGEVGNDAAAPELDQIVIDDETVEGNRFLLATVHGFRGIYLNNLDRFRDALGKLEIADAHLHLDEVASDDGGPASVSQFEPFRLRAEVNRRAGDLPAARLAFGTYIEGYRHWKNAATSRHMIVSSAQSAADLQSVKVETLQRTLAAEREATRANTRNLLVSISALAFGLLILCRMHYVDLRHRRHLVEAANTDPLTGLPNRRHMHERATALLAAARQDGHDFCVALLDLDHFKLINDNYGHLVGDEVLKRVASAAVAQLPVNISMGRWGGEEFLVVLDRHSPEHSVRYLERFRQQVMSIRPHGDAAMIVNFSAGVAGDESPDFTMDQLIDRADKALYCAKAAGRGRTCLFSCGAASAEHSPYVAVHVPPHRDEA